MSSQSEFTLIAQAGTNPGDAFVGALTDGAVRIGYLALSCTTFPAAPRFAAAHTLAAIAPTLTAAALTEAVDAFFRARSRAA
ncbi:hypothetical protein [Azospirillum melinis]|uniref:hypothetical protein n=1 Tax=Azospirillum melinis TaxID=328839 RepID=UPI001AE9CB0E|nr:hypothetical protein [Azospirillum melinis]MBP2310460.1 hypothetical protein [Azospirillum melinis]